MVTKMLRRMVVMGLIAMTVVLASACAALRSSTLKNNKLLPWESIQGMWMNPAGDYRMVVEGREIFFYVADERVLVSRLRLKSKKRQREAYELKLKNSTLEDSHGAVAAIKGLFYEEDTMHVQLVDAKNEPFEVGLKHMYQISFSSFTGGGPGYDVDLSNEEVIHCERRVHYSQKYYQGAPGAGFDVLFYFGGRQAGMSEVTIYKNLSGVRKKAAVFTLEVDADCNVRRALQMPAGE